MAKSVHKEARKRTFAIKKLEAAEEGKPKERPNVEAVAMRMQA